MKRRDRVKWALAARKPDRPPKGELVITSEFINRAAAGSMESLLDTLNADLVTMDINNENKTPWGKWKRQDYYTVGLWQGPFTALCEQVGWSTLADWIVHQPGLAAKWMTRYLHENMQLLDKTLEDECDSILVADDLAGNTGLLVSPLFLQEYYFPIYSMLVRERYKMVPFLFHSDGNIVDIVPLIWQAGFRGIQGLQPSAGLSPAAFSPEVLANCVFWGNFEYEGGWRMKNENEVAQDVIKVLKDWQEVPGYIFGSCGGIYGGIDLQSLKTAYRSVDRYERPGSKRYGSRG